MSDVKITITEEQRKWLRTLLTWIESRGLESRNHPISVEHPEGSGEIVFVHAPYGLVFTILLQHHYTTSQKTDLNLLGRAYLWYQKEGIKWNGN